jgi:UDP-N-acetylenolpyruvoylglucosamine reductase
VPLGKAITKSLVALIRMISVEIKDKIQISLNKEVNVEMEAVDILISFKLL